MRRRPRRELLVVLAPLILVVATWAKLALLSAWMNPIWYPQDRYVGLATASAVIFFCWPLPLLGRTGRYLGALALALLLTLLALADMVHFRVFDEFISAPDLARVPQLRAGWRAALAALRRQDLLLFGDIGLGLACAPFYLRTARTMDERTSWRIAARSSAALGVGALALALPVLHAMQVDREEVYGYTDARQLVVRGIGLVPYHLYDAYIQLAFAARGRLAASRDDRDRAAGYLRAFRAQNGPPSPLTGIARGRNLIIVMAESLQDFPIDLDIDGRAVTPNLRQFAADSLRFTNFFDQTNLGTTSDGEFTSLQSLHPLTAGAVATRYPMNQFHGLPAVLAAHGYDTVSAAGEPGHQWNMRQMHPNLGFQQSFYKPSFRFDFEFGPGVPDHRFLPQSAALLQQRRQPVMAFLLTLSNHAPYELPTQLDPLPVGALAGTLLGGYLQTVHYFDRAFGDFLQELKRDGLFETSVIAVYGDHHGYLDDPAALAQLLGIDASDRRRQWEAQKRLAFFIHLPGDQAAGKRAAVAGHLDVAPTLLGLLGVDPNEMVALGRDLTRNGDHLIVFRDGSFLDDEYECIRAPGPAAASACYDARRGTTVPAQSVEEKRRTADERLAMSDLIISANLIPELMQRFAGASP